VLPSIIIKHQKEGMPGEFFDEGVKALSPKTVGTIWPGISYLLNPAF